MKKLFLLSVFVVISVFGKAQTTYTWIGASGGSWAVSTNWSPTRTTPAATDIIQFNDGATYTVTAVPTQTIRQLLVSNNSNITLQSAAANQTLTINGAAATANLNIASGSTLTLGSATATFTVQLATTTTQLGTIAGTLNVNTSNAFTTTALTTAPGVTVTGTLQNNGGTITSSATSLTFASGGTYVHAMNGGVIPTSTRNAASNTNITGVTTTNPTGLTGAFGNFTWNCAGQTSATGAISGAMTINGNFNIAAGTLLLPTFGITGNATGTFTMASGTTLQVGNGATAVTWPSGFTTANTSLNAASTVIYGAGIAQTISGVPAYGNLTLSGGAFVKTLGAATTVNGNLNVTTGTLADGGFQLTGNSTGTFTLAAATNLQIGAATATITAFPTNFLTSNISLASTSTVTYTTITNAQTVAGSVAGVGPGTYGNLVITGASGTKTLSGNTTVAGNFTMNTSALFADGGNTLTVNGNIVNNGGTHSGAGRILITGGTANHTITSVFNGTTTFGNIEVSDASFTTTISNTSTPTANTVISGTLYVSTGTLNLNGFTTGLTVTGLTTIGNGTNTSSIVYAATGGTRTFTTGITINNAGTFNLGTAGQGPGNTTIGSIVVNTGGVWNNAGNYAMNPVNGSITNNGTFTSGSSTYTLAGTAQSINGTIQFTAISMSAVPILTTVL